MPINFHKTRPVTSGESSIVCRTMSLVIATTSMVILLGTTVAFADKIYKWTDAEGNVHYGSEKPADAPSEKMKVDTGKTGVNRGADALDKLKQEVDDEAQRVVEEGIPEQPPVPALPAREVKKRCQAARQDLATIQSRGQLRERDEKGNTRYIGEEEKQRRIKAAKKQIREYCN
ncbi:MAG: DUF4124 domain-containing protein [Gammaproteobacteria bacterium]|nr:DUF4124 domain-containing protein [Gammaproteobacteria bacterium]